MIERAAAEFPNFAVVATTLRTVRSATVNDWSAIAWSRAAGFAEATPRPGLEILDRVGGGDSFASGLIYGLLELGDLGRAVEYGAAHGALAMTTPGDTSTATLAEVEELVRGGERADPAVAASARRSTAPLREPVSAPPLSVTTPLTITVSIPVASRLGSNVVPSSRNASGSKTAMSAWAPARRTPRSGIPIRSAGWLVSRRIASGRLSTRSCWTQKRRYQAAQVYAPWNTWPGERAVRRHRRRVRARHAERVRERLALLLLGVGVDDHHQAAGIVGRPEQQVVDGIERVLAALGGDRRDVAPRVVGPRLVVEQHDAAPVAAGAEDAHVVAHRAPLLLARRAPRRSRAGSSSAHGGSAVSRKVVP